MVALATEGPRCWNEVRIPSKSWQGKETADSSGLNFTPTSARTALVGGPGSPLPMNKSMLAPEEQRVHSRTLPMNKSMLAPEEQRVHSRTLPMNKSMLAPEEQRVHSRTP